MVTLLFVACSPLTHVAINVVELCPACVKTSTLPALLASHVWAYFVNIFTAASVSQRRADRAVRSVNYPMVRIELGKTSQLLSTASITVVSTSKSIS